MCLSSRCKSRNVLSREPEDCFGAKRCIREKLKANARCEKNEYSRLSVGKRRSERVTPAVRYRHTFSRDLPLLVYVSSSLATVIHVDWLVRGQRSDPQTRVQVAAKRSSR
jgi:uncharacterized protein (DUF3084 family)